MASNSFMIITFERKKTFRMYFTSAAVCNEVQYRGMPNQRRWKSSSTIFVASHAPFTPKMKFPDCCRSYSALRSVRNSGEKMNRSGSMSLQIKSSEGGSVLFSTTALHRLSLLIAPSASWIALGSTLPSLRIGVGRQRKITSCCSVSLSECVARTGSRSETRTLL